MYKRNSKILAALLTIVLVFSIFPSLRVNAAASGTCGAQGDNVTWTLDDAGTLTIKGSGAMADYAYSSDVPWLNYRNSITSVVINNGVTSIGKYAFYSFTSLPSIAIPDSVTSIGDLSFYYCTNLTSVTIPDSVTSIGENSFGDCFSLTSITIPDSVTSIGGCAFQWAGLTNITIPDSVTSIGYHSFYYCTSLKNITIPDSVQDIGDYAFEDCSSLTDVTMSKTLYDKLVADGTLNDVFKDITLPSIHFSYAVDYKSNGNGTITGTTKSFGTDQIELTIQPDNNYELDKIEWSDGTNTVKLTATNGKYTMPDTEAGAVTVTATFKRVKADVTFVSDDGKTVLQTTNYDLNTVPTYTGATPAKAEDAQYTYTFAGWSDGTKTYGPTDTLPAVTDDTTYTAVFDSTVKQYTIKFVNEDGSVLQSGNFDYGTTPAYTGSTPTKAEDDNYTYTFAGWSDGTKTYGPTDTLPVVTDDVTYTATFTETAKPTTTPAPGTYYVQSIEEKDGAIVITIKRTENDDQTYELVQSIETDGKQLTVGDQIELTSGSAIITIKKDFVSTLTPGTHSMKVTFKDGGSITLEYTVKEPEKAQAAVQATGEATAITAFVGIGLILTACGITVITVRKRKEEA